MSKGVDDLTVAISPELIHQRHFYSRARGYGTVEDAVNVFNVNVKDNSGTRAAA